jgi:hypothetical protein
MPPGRRELGIEADSVESLPHVAIGSSPVPPGKQGKDGAVLGGARRLATRWHVTSSPAVHI